MYAIACYISYASKNKLKGPVYHAQKCYKLLPKGEREHGEVC